MQARIAVALLLGCLTGCAGSRLATRLPENEAWGLYEYRRGQVVGQCALAVGDPRRAILQDWLRRNPYGWERSAAAHIPGILILGSTFSINIVSTRLVVVNFGAGQYRKADLDSPPPVIRCVGLPGGGVVPEGPQGSPAPPGAQ